MVGKYKILQYCVFTTSYHWLSPTSYDDPVQVHSPTTIIRTIEHATTFGEAAAAAEAFGIALAVIPSSGEVAFAPPKSHAIHPQDDILFIAHSSGRCRLTY